MRNTSLCHIEKDGKYLMLHRVKKENDLNRDKWVGIGGKFEDGESPEECNAREVLEETSVSIRIRSSFRETVHYSPAVGVCKEVVYFLAFTEQTEIKPREGEIAEVEWVPIESAEKALTHENDRVVLRAALKRIGQNVNMIN